VHDEGPGRPQRSGARDGEPESARGLRLADVEGDERQGRAEPAGRTEVEGVKGPDAGLLCDRRRELASSSRST
jgi:hypothetical protein